MGNLRRPNSNEATGTVNRSKSIVQQSGLCAICLDGCAGGCEVFLSSFRGREVLYPKPFGQITAGADKNYPVDYSHLNIQGYAVGAWGLPDGEDPNPDTAIFPRVDTEKRKRVPPQRAAYKTTPAASRGRQREAASSDGNGARPEILKRPVAPPPCRIEPKPDSDRV